MGLDERLQAARATLPGPDDLDVDVDAALGGIRAGIQRRRTRRQAVTAAAALVVVVAFGSALAVTVPSQGENVVAGEPADDRQGSPPTTDAPPPADDGPIRLWLSTRRVPVEGADLMTVVINESTDRVGFGVYGELDRWEDGAWEHHRHVGFCNGTCVGGLHALHEDPIHILIGLGAEARGVGPALGVRIEGLEQGWYRIRQGRNEDVTATGTFQVVDEDVDLAPHELDTDEPRLEIRPPLVPPAGGAVHMFPSDPQGPSSTGGDDRDRRLGDAVRIDRWDGRAWVEVTTTSGEVPDEALATLEVQVPELPEGAYRAVRFLDDGTSVPGPFWVTDDVP